MRAGTTFIRGQGRTLRTSIHFDCREPRGVPKVDWSIPIRGLPCEAGEGRQGETTRASRRGAELTEQGRRVWQVHSLPRAPLTHSTLAQQVDWRGRHSQPPQEQVADIAGFCGRQGGWLALAAD